MSVPLLTYLCALNLVCQEDEAEDEDEDEDEGESEPSSDEEDSAGGTQ
jgi:hypothetical protein